MCSQRTFNFRNQKRQAGELYNSRSLPVTKDKNSEGWSCPRTFYCASGRRFLGQSEQVPACGCRPADSPSPRAAGVGTALSACPPLPQPPAPSPELLRGTCSKHLAALAVMPALPVSGLPSCWTVNYDLGSGIGVEQAGTCLSSKQKAQGNASSPAFFSRALLRMEIKPSFALFYLCGQTTSWSCWDI